MILNKDVMFFTEILHSFRLNFNLCQQSLLILSYKSFINTPQVTTELKGVFRSFQTSLFKVKL